LKRRTASILALRSSLVRSSLRTQYLLLVAIVQDILALVKYIG